MNNKFDEMLNLMGAEDDNELEELLDQVAQSFTKKLNEDSPPEQNGCWWDIKYSDFGKIIRVSKANDNGEVGYITVNTETNEITVSNPNDRDLVRMKITFAIVVRGGLI